MVDDAAAAFAVRAREGRFELQKCADCGAAAWPPRDTCSACLSDRLEWAPVSPFGVVIAATTLHASVDEFFRSRLPWRIGTVRLDAGPVAISHLSPEAAEGDKVRIEARADWRGRGVLIALPENAGAVSDDPKLSDLVCKK